MCCAWGWPGRGGDQEGEVDEVTQECAHGVDQGMEVDEVT